MIVIAPGGAPASMSAWPISKHAPAASEAGLAMTEQPAANAAAILRAGRSAGKFQADSAKEAPTGW